jgi:hypothetical protein
MSASTILLAQLSIEGCTAELFLNGVPLTRLENRPGRVPIENVAAESFIVPGTNRLEIVVEPGASPSTARSEYKELAFRPMQATGRLIRFEDGAAGTADSGDVLGETSFAWIGAPPSKQAFPLDTSTQIELGPAHGRWAWQDAPVLVLDDALVGEARDVLDDVRRALRAFDADRLWKLAELQLKDVQRAYAAVREAHLRSELATLLDHARKAADPLLPSDPADHDFRLVGGGRLLQLVDRDYTPSVKLRDPGDGSTTGYPLMLARIDGKLRIVR